MDIYVLFAFETIVIIISSLNARLIKISFIMCCHFALLISAYLQYELYFVSVLSLISIVSIQKWKDTNISAKV
jgi:hypothetical protein